MNYLQVVCFIFALTATEFHQSATSKVKNVTGINDRAMNQNENAGEGEIVHNDDIGNKGEQMQQGDRKFGVFLIDSKSQDLFRKFAINASDLNLPLAEVREKWKTRGFGLEDRFVKDVDGFFSRISNETDFTINDIKNGEAIYVDFDADSIKQHLRGLTKDGRAQLMMTNYTSADFKRYPHVRKLNYVGFDSLFTPNSKEMDLLKFGLTDKSANYAEIFNYPASGKNTQNAAASPNHLPVISYSIARFVIEKKEIEISEDDLSINSEFYDVIQRALSTSGLQLASARKLLAILQKYGWYLPLHYKTGGFFYVTHNKTLSKPTEAAHHTHNLVQCFRQAATRKLDAVHKLPPNCERISTSLENVQYIDQNMNPASSPGGFIRSSSLVDMYKDTLREQKQYEIIEYKRLLPTLLLLKNYNNALLSQAIKLLSEYRVDLQQEEADINIREYALTMEQLLYNNQ